MGALGHMDLVNRVGNRSIHPSIHHAYVTEPTHKLWTLGLGWAPRAGHTPCLWSHINAGGSHTPRAMGTSPVGPSRTAILRRFLWLIFILCCNEL